MRIIKLFSDNLPVKNPAHDEIARSMNTSLLAEVMMLRIKASVD